MKTISAAFFITVVVAASPPSGAVPSAAPRDRETVPRRFEPAPLGTQRLEGLLGQRMKTNLEGRLLRVDEAALLDGFRHRPGKQEWIGEHVGKFLDAAARVWLNTRDSRLKTLMDRVAHELVATQGPDGYLGTYLPAQRWTSWDVWVHKYCLMGLVAHHRATGEASSLAAAVKAADLLVATFGPGKRDLVAAGAHVGMAATSVLGPMVDLYRQTGDARYLAFGQMILAAYEQPNGPKLISSLRKRADVQRTANAKAYEMISNVIGLVQLHAVTGEQPPLLTALAAWQDIADNRLYVTGTASSREHFQPPRVLPGEVHDHVGETCVTVNWLELNLELFRLTGESRYAGQIERTVYNHLLGAQDACNGNFCSYTPLNGPKSFTAGVNCCVSSGARGISRLPEVTWGLLDGSPALVLWNAGTAQLPVTTPQGPNNVTLQVQTDFPASGRMTVHVRPTRTARFPIFLRVPAWTTRFAVKGVGQGAPGSFMRVDRTWKRGDRLEIEMEMTVRRAPGGTSYPGRVAVERGPQVLAVDLALDPEIPDRNLVALPAGPIPDRNLVGLPAGPVPDRNPIPDRNPVAFPAGAAIPTLSPVTGSPAKCDAATGWRTPGLTLASTATGTPRVQRALRLVPYADARTPQVWLLTADQIDEYLTARRQRDSKRARRDVRRAATAPVIDGRLDDRAWASPPAARTSLSKKVGAGKPASRASYDLAWDDEALYLAAWVSDPTPQSRTNPPASDHIAVVVDADREAQHTGWEDDIVLRQTWNEPAVTRGVRRASSRSPGGYTVEMAIPWSHIKARPRAGLEASFEIRNHDQGLPGIGDDGDWQWAGIEADQLGLIRLAP